MKKVAKAKACMNFLYKTRLDQARLQAIAKLDDLRSELAMIEKSSEVSARCFNKYSPAEAKVQLFADLFRGREDVCARYWFSQKSGKRGYSPVCEYEWQPGVCTKPEKKCTACKYKPLTYEMLRVHLDGKHILGVYPLRQDETCCFLTVDFDKEGWRNSRNIWLFRAGAWHRCKFYYDRERALDPSLLIPFIQETQSQTWQALEKLHDQDTPTEPANGDAATALQHRK